jgi:RimJ/RimL family protein N-acetyltransferase
VTIETPRLILRPWREEDKPVFETIINTPAMMEHFGGVWPVGGHDILLDAQMASQAQVGFSMWAVDWRETGELIGICGLRRAHHPGTPVTGDLEIGWRIAEPFWGQGVAREAAAASMDWGWRHTDDPWIIAYTTDSNARSWGLMKRLGMERRADLDFRHPKFAEDDPIGAMIVYAIERPALVRPSASQA